MRGQQKLFYAADILRGRHPLLDLGIEDLGGGRFDLVINLPGESERPDSIHFHLRQPEIRAIFFEGGARTKTAFTIPAESSASEGGIADAIERFLYEWGFLGEPISGAQVPIKFEEKSGPDSGPV